MNAPKRKRLRLKEFDYGRSGAYFVTVCSSNRKPVFGTLVGADVLIGPHVQLTPCGQTVKDVLDNMLVAEKYVIMPDHVHILFCLHAPEDGPVRTPAPTQSLPQLVRYMKRSVTIAYGRNVWQRGYYDHVIRNDQDYLEVWNYIDTNPNQERQLPQELRAYHG